MNKKIKNAKSKELNGIKFKSLLELKVYKLLISEGFFPEYEKIKFTLVEAFTPTVPFYTKNKFKRRHKEIKVLSQQVVKDSRKISEITYTPDFYMEYKGNKIIIEAKGIPNDVFPYKFKLFRKLLESMPDKSNYQVWEIFNLKQLKECINHLKISLST